MITSQVDVQRQLSTHTCVGSITIQELASAIEHQYTGDSPPNHLWDLQNADLTSLSTAQVERLATFAKDLVPGRNDQKVAIVSSSVVGLGLARAYRAHAVAIGIEVEIEVFRSSDAARVWLTREDSND